MDLISVLVLTYTVAGVPHESELHLEHTQCLAAAATVSRQILGSRSSRPKVELNNGTFVPVTSAHCLPACMAYGNEELALLSEVWHE